MSQSCTRPLRVSWKGLEEAGNGLAPSRDAGAPFQDYSFAVWTAVFIVKGCAYGVQGAGGAVLHGQMLSALKLFSRLDQGDDLA